MPDRRTNADPSTHRATLDRSLAHIVQRLRTRRAARDVSTAACGVFGALLLYQLALATLASAPAVDALRWVLGAGAAGALVWLGVRLTRRVTTADAAAVADRAADLKDELKSAVWLTDAAAQAPDAQRAGHAAQSDSVFLALLVRRASTHAQHLDARAVVPATLPRSAGAAVTLAVLAAALAGWSPRWAQPTDTSAASLAQAQQAAKAAARAGQGGDGASSQKPGAAGTDPDAANATGASARGSEIDWAQLERVAAALGRTDEAHALAAAIRNRDARKAADLLEQLEHDAESKPLVDRAFAAVARPMRERAGQADAGTGRDLLSAIGDLFRAQVNQVGLDADKSAEANIKKAMEQAEQRAAQNNVPSPPTKGGNPDNTGAGPRPPAEDGDARVNGQGEGNNPGGNSQVSDGSGNHLALAATDGSNPADVVQSRSIADIAPAPVEGPKTKRLEAQLQRVRIDGQQQPGDAHDNAEDKLYAATRAQRSSLDYQAVTRAPRLAKEEAMPGERVPLAHRAAVRDYFLNQRQAEKQEK